MLKFLIEKEFKQIIRNAALPRLLIMMPLMTMVLFPWAANMELKNVHVCVVDNDLSPLSLRLTNKIDASPYLAVQSTAPTYAEAMRTIEAGTADAIVTIPPRFERELLSEGSAAVQISANAVNGMKGSLSASYLSTMIQLFTQELREENRALLTSSATEPASLQVNVSPRFKYNLHMDYKVFMVPALMVMLLTMLCGFLPALNIVSEKEIGTIEQINVTPVGKFTFILAKLLPYWIIGVAVFSLSLLLAHLLYGMTPAGNLLTIYAGAALFILAVSGLGLLISNHSETIQQAMFVMLFLMIVLILLSGLFTPISSMPAWAQWITVFNPLRYLMEVMRLVYLKGSGIGELGAQFGALALFAGGLNLWAILSYRKSS